MIILAPHSEHDVSVLCGELPLLPYEQYSIYSRDPADAMVGGQAWLSPGVRLRICVHSRALVGNTHCVIDRQAPEVGGRPQCGG